VGFVNHSGADYTPWLAWANDVFSGAESRIFRSSWKDAGLYGWW
jgi:hypothetical protein